MLLVWKVMTGAVDIKPEEVGLHRAARGGRGADPNPLKLIRQGGSDEHSPLWRATSIRTIADFNALTGTQVEAADAGIFSRSLANNAEP